MIYKTKKHPTVECFQVVVPERFELSSSEPKSDILSIELWNLPVFNQRKYRAFFVKYQGFYVIFTSFKLFLVLKY